MTKFKIGDKVMINQDPTSVFEPDFGIKGKDSVKLVSTITEETTFVEPKEVEDECSKYSDEEIWYGLYPKMKQFYSCPDSFPPVVKKIIVSAYKSGWGRAKKNRNFIINRPDVEKQIDEILKGKKIVIFYNDKDAYTVSSYLKVKKDIPLLKDELLTGFEICGTHEFSNKTNFINFGEKWYTILNNENMYVCVPMDEKIKTNHPYGMPAYPMVIVMRDMRNTNVNIKQYDIGAVVKYAGATLTLSFKEDDNVVINNDSHNFCLLLPIVPYLKCQGAQI